MHDNFRGSKLSSSLTKLLAQTITECLLRGDNKKCVIFNPAAFFLLIVSVFVDSSFFPAGLKMFVVQKQLALLFLDVY